LSNTPISYVAMHKEFIRTATLLSMEQLQTLTAWWAPWLGLTDWIFDLRIERGSDMRNNTASGTSRWTGEKRRASIALVDPNDYNHDAWDPYDMEQVLVHEMLHVSLGGIDDTVRSKESPGLLNREIEQFIDRLATSLTTMGRHHPKHPLRRRKKS